MTFNQLLDKKNKRLKDVPKSLQKVLEAQQPGILNDINSLLSSLELSGDSIKINAKNLKLISQIADDLRGVVLNDEYLSAVKEFAKEFNSQALLNDQLIETTFKDVQIPDLSKVYVETAKKGAIESLVGAPIDTEFIKPIQGILENAVTSGATYSETLTSIRNFVEGEGDKEAKLLRYAKQITNDAFAISDRSYTNIVSEALGAEWYYYSGGEFSTTRCFCDERLGKFFHYKEIESWGRGENLGKCDIGGGKWAGEIDGTNEQTIFNFAGGYNCQHSFMIVSEAVVPEEDIQRAISMGFIEA